MSHEYNHNKEVSWGRRLAATMVMNLIIPIVPSTQEISRPSWTDGLDLRKTTIILIKRFSALCLYQYT